MRTTSTRRRAPRVARRAAASSGVARRPPRPSRRRRPASRRPPPITTSASPLRPRAQLLARGSRQPSSTGSARRRARSNCRCTAGDTIPVVCHGPQLIDTTRAGQRRSSSLGELVEHLARGRVVGLAAVAEAAGDRAEEDEEAQRLGPQLARPACVRRRPWSRARARTSRASLSRTSLSSMTPAPWMTPSMRPWRVVDVVDQRAEGLGVAHVARRRTRRARRSARSRARFSRTSRARSEAAGTRARRAGRDLGRLARAGGR